MQTRNRFSLGASALVVLGLLFSGPIARAEEPAKPQLQLEKPLILVLPMAGVEANTAAKAPKHKIEWDPKWRKFSIAEGVATGALGGWALAVDHVIPVTTPHWTGTNGFDDGIRNTLRASTPGGRATANTLSNIGVGVLVALPLVDAGLSIGLADKNPKVMAQVMAIDVESLATAISLTNTGKDIIGRARPYTRDCTAGSTDPRCAPSNVDKNRSDWSGHTAMSFTGAGLLCSTHLNMRLYHKLLDGTGPTSGFQVGDFLDKALCVTAAATATGVGVARIVADYHYASDVLIGAGVGTAAGVLLPQLLHFGFGGETTDKVTGEKRKNVEMSVVPETSDTYKGLTVTGRF